MKVDAFGVAYNTALELCDMLYANPQINLHELQVYDPEDFNRSVKELYYDCTPLTKYGSHLNDLEKSIEEEIADFDAQNQSNWFMPDEYKTLDIAKWLLEQCNTDEELQRVGKELLMFQDRNLLVLLQFMKYFVDTMRKHKVVWGVGRGSSTASYCLFLLGVHRIDSIYYELEVEEFLK